MVDENQTKQEQEAKKITFPQRRAITHAHRQLGREYDADALKGMTRADASAMIGQMRIEVEDIATHDIDLIDNLDMVRTWQAKDQEDVERPSWADSNAMAAGKTVTELRDLIDGVLIDMDHEMDRGEREGVAISDGQKRLIRETEKLYPDSLAPFRTRTLRGRAHDGTAGQPASQHAVRATAPT